jgi:hypothetical protein
LVGRHTPAHDEPKLYQRHCEEPLRRSNPFGSAKKRWIASLRSQ